MTRRTALLSSLAAPAAAIAADEYRLGPDSRRQPNVPRGTVTQHTWASKLYPGTVRDYWVYVPSQYKAEKPVCLMVFQDGKGFVSEGGSWRVPIVFDNLIHNQEMPVTVGVFVDPGVLPAPGPDAQSRYNRSFEYDDISDWYVQFLVHELLPEVRKQYSFSDDPNCHGIAGSSSGGIAAFTAAWHRPDVFRRVLSFIGSYTNLRGGEVFASLIRKTEIVPLRVFLQDGTHDLNIYAGNWYLANQQMASALEYAGYDVKFVVGTEDHNAKHGGAILPDALRWLWRDYPNPVPKPSNPNNSERHFVDEILDAQSEWKIVSAGHRFTEGPAVDREGNVFFSDIPANRIYKIAVDGKVSLFREDTGGTNGLMLGPDGRLYGCQNGRKQIVAYSPDGKETVLAEGVDSNDLAVNKGGEIYFSDPPHHRVWFIDAQRRKRIVHEGLDLPNGVRFSPDQSLLFVCDTKSKWVWSLSVMPDGSLANAEPFFLLEIGPDQIASGADGMTVDDQGYLWVATNTGIQICDQPGRVVAIVRKPQPGSLSNIVLGGPDRQTLFATAGDKVFSRRVRRKGVVSWEPVKPPTPRL
ncbi:MAG: SMP-30/gluconolactonase/LRE family protein [Acidobacteriaceae bacterium]|nr:SMP-30/gluconolactonase/LRE family protein [Acidobacteriaceae bacterium]